MVQQVQKIEEGSCQPPDLGETRKTVPLDIACYLIFRGALPFRHFFPFLPDHVPAGNPARVSSVPCPYVAGEPRSASAMLSDGGRTGSSRPYDAAPKWRRRRDLILQISVTIDK